MSRLRNFLVGAPGLVACVLSTITPIVRCAESADVNALVSTLGLSGILAMDAASAVQELSENTTDVGRAAAACAISRIVFGNQNATMVNAYIDPTATNYVNRVDVNWYVLAGLERRRCLDGFAGLIHAGSMLHALFHLAQQTTWLTPCVSLL